MTEQLRHPLSKLFTLQFARVEKNAHQKGHVIVLEWLLAFIILLISITFYLKKEAGIILQIAVLLLAVVPMALLITKNVDIPMLSRGVRLAFSLFIIFSLSILFNMSNYANMDEAFLSIVLLLNVLFVMLIGAVLAAANNDFLVAVFKKYALLGFLFLLVVILVEIKPGAIRQTLANIHPNWWGMVIFSVFSATIFITLKPIRVAIWLFCLYMMFLVSARGVMLGALVIMMLMGGGAAIKQRNHLLIAGSLTIAVLLTAFLVLDIFSKSDMLQQLTYFVMHDVFWVDNAYRGLGTGLGGRMEGYQLALVNLMNNPVWGIGYGNGRSIHNGFLLVLTETGIVGLCSFLFLLVLSFLRGGSLWTNPFSILMAGYLVLMMTYPRALNVNAGSILFIFCFLNNLIKPYCRDNICPQRY